MGISSNIKAFRKSRDWTQEQLAEKVGVTRATVTQWETGWSQPRMSAVERLAAAFGVTVSDMVADDRPPIPGSFRPAPSRLATAPLLGRIHAGDAQEPDILEESIELPYSVLESHPNAYFLEVEGDCMDKVYPEGCLILVDPDREPQNGSVAAVSIDGADYVMRRMLRTSSTIVLAPESFNDEHEDIVITVASGKTVELAGTVVWFQPSKEME